MKYSIQEILIKIFQKLKIHKLVRKVLDKLQKFNHIDLTQKIKIIEINTTNYESELCLLGKKYNSDKSPINSSSVSRHSYTGIYNLLFGTIKNNNLNVGEFGILNNASMKMWREYFKNSKLYGFENDRNLIEKAKKDNLENTFYSYTDVTSKEEILYSLQKTNVNFDIIIDDSNHIFESQINIIEITKDFIKDGGLLIIEDIYTTKKKHSVKNYFNKLEKYKSHFSEIYFINCKHINNYNRLYPHHRILVLKK